MRLAKIFLFCVFIHSCRSAGGEKEGFSPPVAKSIPKTFNENGHIRTDPYYWLNDPKDPGVIAQLHAENEYTDSVMQHTSNLQQTLYSEMEARLDQQYESLPVKQNGYWYYIRYRQGNQYPLYCRKKDLQDAPEEIMLDGNEIAKGHQISIVRSYSCSRDNRWLAYGVDTTGGRQCIIYFKNLQTGSVSAEFIPNAGNSYAWANDHKTFYYTLLDHTVRSYRVMRHTLGTDPSTDKPLFSETDSTYSVGLSTTRDNRFIFIQSNSTTTSESRYLDANNPHQPPVLIQARLTDLLYYPKDYEGDHFYFQTNRNAKNFKLVSVPISQPDVTHWQDLIPHRDSALLEEAEVLRGFVITQYQYKGLPEIKILNRMDKREYKIDFEEECFLANIGTATDAFDLDSIRYVYSSFTTPESIFSFDLRSKEKKLLKQQKVGGGFESSNYETHRLWAKSADGTLIPISVVYRKDRWEKDGSHPLMLLGYGSYGINNDPDFDPAIISLLDRGFGFGIAHIRGGQEMGRYWYEDGKLLHKKNTFSDFLDCAQYLVNEKYTNPEKMFAIGRSAGGMLMGAVINMRPELFRGVVAEVPWMDVMTDMFNPDLPLTTLEYNEWGDPHKPEFYDYMLSWSPYDNMKETIYPAVLTTGGLNDTQVPYFSPAKWVQKARALNKGHDPILFKCNMGAGHNGESGRFEQLKLTALIYAFVLDLAGIRK